MRHIILTFALSLLLLFTVTGCGRDQDKDSAWARPGAYSADNSGHVYGFGDEYRRDRQMSQTEENMSYSMQGIENKVPVYIR